MISTLDRKPVGHFLLAKGFVKQEILDRALEEQKLIKHKKLIGELLVEKNICTDEQITEALAEAYEVPFVHVHPRVADPRVISVLPAEFIEKHHVLPLFVVEGVLTIALPEPANLFLLEEIERISGFKAQIVAATIRDITATYRAYVTETQAFVIDDLFAIECTGKISVVQKRTESAIPVSQVAIDSPAGKVVDFCLQQAIQDGASDIHIEPGDNVLRIRHRIDGRMVERLRPPPNMRAAITARVKQLASLDIATPGRAQETRLQIQFEARQVDLRISIMPGRWGENIVIRLLDNEKSSAHLEKLGFGYDILKKWRKLIHQPNGMVLVSGPTGSGKTATLYASIGELNSDEVNICTIEDPVACPLHGVNQFEVSEVNGFSYPAAFRSVLQQDPDVVLVGAIKEIEIARIAMQSALTGQLILSTMHTNDAPSSLVRLCNLGVEPYLVAASVTGVLAQRQIRKLCQRCKEQYVPTITERRHLEKFGVTVDEMFRPKGCDHCRNLGFVGRVAIHELLVMNDQLSDRLSHGAGLAEIRELAAAGGMKSLRADGIEKVRAGITTLDEVYRVST